MNLNPVEVGQIICRLEEERFPSTQFKELREQFDNPFDRIYALVIEGYEAVVEEKKPKSLNGQDLNKKITEKYYRPLFYTFKEIEEKYSAENVTLRELDEFFQARRQHFKENAPRRERKYVLQALKDAQNLLEKEFEWEKIQEAKESRKR